MPGPDDLRAYLLPIVDVDDPIVLRMRHEPDPASAHLLVVLGAGWIVDENAPACVRSCGRPECAVLSAHQLFISRDCVTVGCPREAAHGDDRCDDCIRNPPRPRVADADLFGAFDDEPDERSTTMSVAETTCKKPGCEVPANPSYTRGYQYGYCNEHAAERGIEISTARRNNGRSGDATGGGQRV